MQKTQTEHRNQLGMIRKNHVLSLNQKSISDQQKQDANGSSGGVFRNNTSKSIMQIYEQVHIKKLQRLRDNLQNQSKPFYQGKLLQSNDRQPIILPNIEKQPEKIVLEKPIPIEKIKELIQKNESIQDQKNSQRVLKPNNTQQKKRKNYNFQQILTDDEKQLYEDRDLDKFTKLSLLGRGGYSLVWKVEEDYTKRLFAAKQVLRKHADSYKNELGIMKLLGDFFKTQDDSRSELFLNCHDCKVAKKDMWILYDVGGGSLNKELFQIQGQFVNGGRVYMIRNQDLYTNMLTTPILLKSFIVKLAQSLQVLQTLNLVHNDLKPENILITHTSDKITQLKLSDFGSAYPFGSANPVQTATPEYVPPEGLLNQPHLSHPHSTDAWAFGVILLEILTGIPVWMNFRCQVFQGNRHFIRQGLFACKNRCHEKISQKQSSIVENLETILRSQWGEWGRIVGADLLLDLVGGLLVWEPQKRLTPGEVLKHPFVQEVDQFC